MFPQEEGGRGKRGSPVQPPRASGASIQFTSQLPTRFSEEPKYSDIKITQEGDKFRVTATRFSNLKKYSSPLSLLIGRDKNDVWLIYEELSESQP